MSNYIQHDGVVHPIKTWTQGVPLDPQALEQLRNVSALPFIHRHVAAMPDVHWGMGATVGSVIATKGAIIPAAVGVDIGCGMCALRTSLTSQDLPDNLNTLRTEVERRIPLGMAVNQEISGIARQAWAPLASGYDKLAERFPKIETKRHARYQIGSLGGGNHFIEFCLDEADRLWVMLHSGSRGVGNRIGQIFIETARKEAERQNVVLPDKDLAYLKQGSEHFDAYVEAVGWAQRFARLNRDVMLDRVMLTLREHFKSFTTDKTAINCHHNYVEEEEHFGETVLVTRKGAVRAREGDLGIIPGSMGTRSYIVRGKGNPDSFHSCSHGAGRVMSRNEAKRRFTIEDHVRATAHVECRKDANVIDETPMAYKDIDAVMAAQTDLVDIVHTLRQIVCVKG